MPAKFYKLDFGLIPDIIDQSIDQDEALYMGRVVSATEARIHFGELMREVIERRQPVIVERGGKPQVVVLSIAEYEDLLAGQSKQTDWKELVRRAREQVQADLGERKLPPPEDTIREMREERDGQLVDLR